MVRAQVLEFVRNLAPHHHSVFFYDSLEDKHEVLAVFVEAGLENGELVIYVASEETPRQITEALKGYGVDAGHEGLRILNFDQWYVIDGRFSRSTVTQNWQKAASTAIESGYKGLRAMGEAAFAFSHGLEEKFSEYELSLGSELKIPMTAICQYTISVIPSDRYLA
ncbi:MAG: MEDS domain-containing protein [Candidatus Bathyarchaeia archaeon]